MKRTLKILLIIALCAVIKNATAQTPGGINFQGVARNKLFENLSNKPITLRINILDQSPNGTSLYNEVRNTTTDSFGVFNVVIGGAGFVSQSGDIKQVKWSTATKKLLQVEMDIQEGSGFLNMGTTQLVSVPFSFYSDVSDSARIANYSKNSYSSSLSQYSYISDSARIAAKADSAQFAVKAGTALKVDSAQFAAQSATAMKSDSAKFAVKSAAALKSDSAKFAAQSTTALKSDSAKFAAQSAAALKADSAKFAAQSATALKADSAKFAVQSATADIAITAINANFALVADSAKFAVKSDSTNFTLRADSAKFAVKSDSTNFTLRADSAKFAVKSDSAKFSNSSGTYFFSATMPPGVFQNVPKNASAKYIVKFPRVLYNEGNTYDSATSTFTAPEDGIYQFDIIIAHEIIDEVPSYDLTWALVKNDIVVRLLGEGGLGGGDTWGDYTLDRHVRITLVKDDKITIRLASLLGAIKLGLYNDDLEVFNGASSSAFVEFSGYKIK